MGDEEDVGSSGSWATAAGRAGAVLGHDQDQVQQGQGGSGGGSGEASGLLQGVAGGGGQQLGPHDVMAYFSEPAGACGLVVVEAEGRHHPANGGPGGRGVGGAAAAGGGAGAAAPSSALQRGGGGLTGALGGWHPVVVVPDEGVAGEINGLLLLAPDDGKDAAPSIVQPAW